MGEDQGWWRSLVAEAIGRGQKDSQGQSGGEESMREMVCDGINLDEIML